MEKICEYCKSELNDGDKFCQNCGAEVKSETVTSTNTVENNNIQNNDNVQNNYQYNDINGNAKTNPSAIAGFVCSLVGILLAGIAMGIIAICLGVAAKNHMKVFKNEKGNGLATAAIVIGIIDIVFTTIGLIFRYI